MTTARELYELWAGTPYADLTQALAESLEPRGTGSLFEAFAGLDPQPGQLVVDVGARDAGGAIRLVREHGVRALALDPVPLHCERARAAVAEAGLAEEIDVVEAGIEKLPLADASADSIWCRDVLTHVDAARGFAECARVLRPGGAMLAYVTLATARLEPREFAELVAAAGHVPESFRPESLEAAAEAAGLALRSVDRIDSEWRERWIEDGEWDAGADLLSLARLRRGRDELAARYGDVALDGAWSGLVWGIYQLLGKLCPTVYVWERRA
jgi:SAM-dependent methyltransferase